MKLKDIAQQAGVSISTVSRVLRSPDTNAASKEVRDRIWKIVRETGYLPNETARALKSGKEAQQTQTAQSIYCLIATSPEEQKDDAFYTRLITSIEYEALKSKYILEYTFSAPDLSSESTLQRLKENRASGLIIIGRFQPELLNQIRQYFKHVVYTGLNTINAPCDQVICDGYQAVCDMVQYFYKHGHREIAYIGASPDVRLNGYLDSLAALDLPRQDSLIIDDIIPSMNGGYRSMTKLINGALPFSAVCCANDTTAIGALRACKDLNVRVPDDISIMGMNDIETIQYVSPMLSSISVPLEEMGRMTVKLLIDRISGGHRLPVRSYLPYYIVERESCR
jgi:LacI family transcriptional regulator